MAVTASRLRDYAVIYNPNSTDDEQTIQDVLFFVSTTVDLYQTGAPETIKDLAILRLGSWILQTDNKGNPVGRSNAFSLSGARGMLKPYAHRRGVLI